MFFFESHGGKENPNVFVKAIIQGKVGKQEQLSTVKSGKMACFGHVMRHQKFSEIILQGTVPGAKMGNIRELRELVRLAEDWPAWRMPLSQVFQGSSMTSPVMRI